ncbi:MAG: hypothetical protein R2742_10875 [Micropruina glycogenica]
MASGLEADRATPLVLIAWVVALVGGPLAWAAAAPKPLQLDQRQPVGTG